MRANDSVGEYVRDMVQTNGMESFWSTLRRGYWSVSHHMSPKHLNRYVNEFVGRHNVLEADTADQMTDFVIAMTGKRLKYRDLVA